MYKKSDKRRIYELIEQYLSDQIDEIYFCDEFYHSFDLEIDYDSLNKEEEKVFYELSEVTSRFSEFEEDIEKYPGIYRTKAEVKLKITETRKKLDNYFKEFNSNKTIAD